MRTARAILLMLMLSGCSVENVHAPPPRTALPRPLRAPAPDPRETQACFADLARADVRFTPIPDRDFGGGCALLGTVQLLDIGVPVSGIKAMRCGLAREFAGWVRFALVPAARQILGSDLVRVETFGSYACRNTVGTASAYTRLSGHATANAVDVAAFVLADGRRVSVLSGWRSNDPREPEFLRVVHASACRRFGTVLGPEYNEAHQNHFHLEDDHASFCR